MTGSCYRLLMDVEHNLLIGGDLFLGADESVEGMFAADQSAIEFPPDTLKALCAFIAKSPVALTSW